jgi:integrase
MIGAQLNQPAEPLKRGKLECDFSPRRNHGNRLRLTEALPLRRVRKHTCIPASARKLFRSIDTSHVIGLCDRGVLGVLAYTGARIGAVARLRMADCRNLGDHRVLRFREEAARTGR